MTTLADPDVQVKLLKARRALERPNILEGVPDTQRWNVRCMHVGCDWKVEGLLSCDASTTAGQLHANATGHPCRRRAVVEFEAGTIRAEREVS